MPQIKINEVRKGVQGAGFEPVFADNIKDAFEHLGRSADFDAILLYAAPGLELPYILTQLRSDADQGRLPIVVFAGKDREEGLAKIAARHRLVAVVPEVRATMPEELKATLDGLVKDSAGTPLSAEERKKLRETSLNYLYRMAGAEIPGYDIRPAKDAVLQALQSEELAPKAVEILGRLPGTDIQQRLGGIVLDPSSKVRYPAALELNRHIRKHGLLLNTQQLNGVQAAFKDAKEDPAMREQLALVIGSMRPGAVQTGLRIQQFQPDPREAPMPPQKKEGKEKKKD